jgi:hypothetical protein
MAVKLCGAVRYMPECTVGPSEVQTAINGTGLASYDSSKIYIYDTYPGDKVIHFVYDPAKCSLDQRGIPKYFCLYT